MKNIYDIIIAPVITEDSMAMGADKKYAFRVMSDATKPEIAQAVETIFKVDVKCVIQSMLKAAETCRCSQWL